MQRGKSGLLRLRSQMAILLVIALALLILGGLGIVAIQRYYYSRAAVEAQRFAWSYANTLEKALEAAGAINRLLEERLEAAGEQAVSLPEDVTDEKLSMIAQTMGVDEICLYSGNGKMEHSSSGQLTGGTDQPGQPAYEFLMSGEQSRVDCIGQDTRTGTYLKEGYFRGTGDRFARVCILSKTAGGLLDAFDIRRLLDGMEADPYILEAAFLEDSPSGQALAAAGIGEGELSAKALAAMAAGSEYVGIANRGSAYRVLVPVYVQGQKSGTLMMTYDLKDTRELMKHISIAGLALLLLLYAFMLAITIANNKTSRRLAHYAYHDPLSDLPNRWRFEEALREDATGGHRDSRAVLLISYRNFNQINLLFGYQYGEMVIRALAGRLGLLKSEDYRLFHLSADRFAFYVTGYQGREELSAMCFKIIGEMKEALPAKTIGGTIGVVEAAYFRNDADTILKYATLAGTYVGESEPFGFCFYSSGMEAQLQRESDIQRELQEAVEREDEGGLYLVYQPILHIKSGRITGMEALSRLKSGQLKDVSPTEFIPIAEKTQLIVPLGRRILREACGFLKTLETQGYKEITVSVNISAMQLMRDEFVADVLAIVAETEANPARLGLEITESTFVDRMDEINGKLTILKACGICIAIDDFGTGYSSLAREQDLNVSCLKIDKSFVAQLSVLPPEKAITGDIISMAHRLGHEVVAEGVENMRQKEYLAHNGCDYLQGFLFSKPLLPKDALALLQVQRNAPEGKEAFALGGHGAY